MRDLCLSLRVRARSHSILIIALLAAGADHAASQGTPPVQSGVRDARASKPLSFRIAGKAVNDLDGHVLQRAVVKIAEVKTGRVVATMITGESGEFAFDHLRPDKYSLSGQAHGYVDALYEEHERYSTAIVTGAGLDTESLLLRLTPVATLAGRVLDESGDPIRGAQVTIYVEDHGSGKAHVERVSSSQTNDRGEYGVTPLGAGNYYVAATAVPWYAIHPSSLEKGMDSALVTGVDPALDVAYPFTFYPDVTNSDAATPIAVKGGDQIHIDLHLKPVHAVRFTIHTTPGEQIAYPQLQVPVFGGFEMVMGQMQNSSPYGTEMVGLAPGQYKMMQANPQTGTLARTRMIDLADGNSEVVPEGAGETGSLKVTLEDESGAKLPAGMQVLLRGTSPENVQGQGTNERGEAIFAGLLADSYHVQVYGQGLAYRVLQVMKAGKKLPNDELLVSTGDTDVTIITTETIISVEGVAKRNGKPAAGVMILLVPVDAFEKADLFRRDQSDLDGTFSLRNVSPGRYIVLGIEDGWTLDWGKVEVLARYLPKGVPIEVPVTARRSLQLPDAINVQPR